MIEPNETAFAAVLKTLKESGVDVTDQLKKVRIKELQKDWAAAIEERNVLTVRIAELERLIQTEREKRHHDHATRDY